MNPLILLFLSLLGLAAAAPISITTSSSLPTGVYTYTGTAITVSGTSIVVPSGTLTAASHTSIAIPSPFVFPPAMSVTALPSPSVAVSADFAHVSVIPGLHGDVAAGDVHLGGSGFGDGHGQDGSWCVGCGKEQRNGTLVEYSHHSSPATSPSASATPTSAENTRLGAPHPHSTLPRHEDEVDGNYSVGVPGESFSLSYHLRSLLISSASHSDHVSAEDSCVGAPHCEHGHHSSAASPLPSPSPSAGAISAEHSRIGAPAHHGDDHAHGFGAEYGCVGCPGGEHAGGHGDV